MKLAFYRGDVPDRREIAAEENKPLQPILLDKVLGTRPRSHGGCPLLRLPSETLHQIADHLQGNEASLSNLALVNWDLCQLVRASRFVDVLLMEDARAMEIVFTLAQEVIQRAKGNTRPTIGACIRRLRIGPLAQWNSRGHCNSKLWQARLQNMMSDMPTDISTLSEEQIEAHDMGASMQCINTEKWTDKWDDNEKTELSGRQRAAYLNAIITAMRFAMPNLTALELEGGLKFDGLRRNHWRELSHCLYRIHDLKIGMTVEDWPKLRAWLDPQKLILRSLALDIRLLEEDFPVSNYFGTTTIQMPSQTDDFRKPRRQKYFNEEVTTILEGCAETLETFVLSLAIFHKTHLNGKIDGFQTPQNPIHFPALRTVGLERLDHTKGAFFSLMNSGVRHLKIGREDVKAFFQLLRMVNLRDLESLSIPNLEQIEWTPGFTRLLERHSHIRRLHIQLADVTALDEHIIPCLTGGSFSHLTSLSLQWFFERAQDQPVTPADIAPASLAAIGRIETLELFYLQAVSDDMDIYGCEWKVNHDDLRCYLEGLQRLRLLALTADDYSHHFKSPYFTHFFWWPAPQSEWGDEKDEAEDDSVLGIDTEYDGMYGRLVDLNNMRARPELDDYMFDPAVLEAEGLGVSDLEVEEVIPDNFHGRSWIGPVTDRYSILEMRDWFELVLRNILLAEAERYAAAFPRLQLAYLGQLLMEFKVAGSGLKGNAVPLYKRRRHFDDIPSALFDSVGGGGGPGFRPSDWL